MQTHRNDSWGLVRRHHTLLELQKNRGGSARGDIVMVTQIGAQHAFDQHLVVGTFNRSSVDS